MKKRKRESAQSVCRLQSVHTESTESVCTERVCVQSVCVQSVLANVEIQLKIIYNKNAIITKVESLVPYLRILFNKI